MYEEDLALNNLQRLILLYSLHNGLTLLYKYMSTRASEESAPITVTQSRVIPFA